MIKHIRKTKKNESLKNKRWFVLDLNTTEECDSLEEAMDKAEWWIQIQKDQIEDADDEEVARWYRHGDQGLDTGDVEIYEVDLDEVDLDDITDDYGHVSGRMIRDLLEPVDVLSGFSVTEEEAEKRKLESKCRRRNAKTFKEEREKTETENKLRKIIDQLLSSKDFNSLASCSVIGSFKRASYMLKRIDDALSAVDNRGLLSDTYLDIQSLRDDLKDCLDFLTSVNPRKHFTMSDYRGLVELIKESISLLEK